VKAMAAIVFVFMLYASLRFVFRVAVETARLLAVVVMCAVLLAICSPARADEIFEGAMGVVCWDCAIAPCAASELLGLDGPRRFVR